MWEMLQEICSDPAIRVARNAVPGCLMAFSVNFDDWSSLSKTLWLVPLDLIREMYIPKKEDLLEMATNAKSAEEYPVCIMVLNRGNPWFIADTIKFSSLKPVTLGKPTWLVRHAMTAKPRTLCLNCAALPVKMSCHKCQAGYCSTCINLHDRTICTVLQKTPSIPSLKEQWTEGFYVREPSQAWFPGKPVAQMATCVVKELTRELLDTCIQENVSKCFGCLPKWNSLESIKTLWVYNGSFKCSGPEDYKYIGIPWTETLNTVTSVMHAPNLSAINQVRAKNLEFRHENRVFKAVWWFPDLDSVYVTETHTIHIVEADVESDPVCPGTSLLQLVLCAPFGSFTKYVHIAGQFPTEPDPPAIDFMTQMARAVKKAELKSRPKPSRKRK